MDFRVLGPLEVGGDEGALALGGARQRSVLAILLLNANELVSTDLLIDAVWGASPPLTARKTIQVYVSRLRGAVGDERLVTRPAGYVLYVEPAELDLARFEQLVAEARRAPAEAASSKLREALALWRGPALADLAYEEFAQAEVARLEELRLAAIEQRIDADLQLGRHAELVAELETQVARHPLREHFRYQLMLALYRSDRQAEALEAYRRAREELSEELGLEPSEALKPAAERFLDDFGEAGSGGFILESAQATALVLGAIARSDGTRESVLAKLKASRVKNGILGSFRFDRNGDLTPAKMPIIRITGSTPPSARLPEFLQGAVVDRAVEIPRRLIR
jgi:DNA-binding SARP family transcriptional activator